MKLKQGVEAKDIRPEILLGAVIVESAAQKVLGNDYVMTITSIKDGRHRSDSLHYKGLAVDIRINDMGGLENVNKILQLAADFLGNEFDIVLESDHIHLEFDPK